MGALPAGSLTAPRPPPHTTSEVSNSAVANAGQGMEQEAKEVGRLAVASEGGQMHSLLKHIDAQIEALGSNGFCVGDQLTMADLSLS
jgi:glutathione S-transferase